MSLDKRFIIALLLALCAFGCQSATQTNTAKPKAQVKEVADAAWQNALNRNISLRLKHQQPIKEFPDLTLARAEKDAASARALIAKMDAIPQQGLDHEDALTLAIIRWEAEGTVERLKYYWLSFPVTPYVAGQQLNLMHRVFAIHQFKADADQTNYLALTAGYADHLDQMLDKLKKQEEKNLRLPRPEIPAVMALFSAHRANSDKLFGVAPTRLADLAAK